VRSARGDGRRRSRRNLRGPLYLACGFTEIDRRDIVMPDGVSTAGVLMTRPISTPEGR
jgi:hypothetical protein